MGSDDYELVTLTHRYDNQGIELFGDFSSPERAVAYAMEIAANSGISDDSIEVSYGVDHYGNDEVTIKITDNLFVIRRKIG